MTLPLANVQTTDTFQTWLTRTNQIIDSAANNVIYSGAVANKFGSNTNPIVYNVTVGTKSSDHPFNGIGSGSAYYVDGIESPALQLRGINPGYPSYYKFDQSDSSNGTHPLYFYLDKDRTIPYTRGVTVNGTAGNAGAATWITVDKDTPNILYYQCLNHAYMGYYAQSDSANYIHTSLTANTITANTASFNQYVDFAGAAHDTLPFTEGRVYYDTTHKSLTVFSDGGLEMELGQNEYIRVYNNSGVPINLGQPIYLSGATGDVPNAFLANASDSEKYNISGLAANAIPTSSYGFVAVSGVLRGFDTSTLTEGERFFVSPNANGTLQTTAPTFPNFPMCVGLCVVSNTVSGEVVIEQQNHSVPSFRVINDAHIGGNFTVAGNFNVTGTETVTSVTNLQVDDSFVYLNGGDTLTANSTLVTGLNDLTFKGHYNGGNNVTYYVKVDSTGGGAPDKFSWSLDNFSTTEQANVAITGESQTLRWGVGVQFIANTGHTAGDIWTAPAAPVNIDTGWASNRNTGQAAGGYTHLGMFFDVSDERFKVFESYRPSVSGTIDVSHASFAYGDVQANTFYGTFNGTSTGDGSGLTSLNASQLTSGTVPIARLSGSGITLGTHTTGNYVATVANTDNNVTVSGSGSETAAVSVGLADDLNLSGTVTASAFVGDGSGLTNAGAVVAAKSDNVDYKVTFTNQLSGAYANSFVNTSLLFNPSTGQLKATDFNSTSDERLKKNIKPIDDALGKVLSLAGVEFDWAETDQSAIGVIAQQVEQVVPELVHTDASGFKSVSYGNLTALLIEAIKELKTIVDGK